MALFFTADLHLGHANIMLHCGRPFATVEEMDAKIIGNWNAVVRPEDTVYVLGDFARGDAAPYLRRLMGRVVLVRGNHDLPKCLKFAQFAETHELLELKNKPRKGMSIVLCHYPLAT